MTELGDVRLVRLRAARLVDKAERRIEKRRSDLHASHSQSLPDEQDSHSEVADDAVEDDQSDLGNPGQQTLELLNLLTSGVLLSLDRGVDRLDIIVVWAERDAEFQEPESVGPSEGSGSAL